MEHLIIPPISPTPNLPLTQSPPHLFTLSPLQLRNPNNLVLIIVNSFIRSIWIIIRI